MKKTKTLYKVNKPKWRFDDETRVFFENISNANVGYVTDLIENGNGLNLINNLKKTNPNYSFCRAILDALKSCAQKGTPEFVKYLVDKGLPFCQKTISHYIKCGDGEMVIYFLKKNIDSKQEDIIINHIISYIIKTDNAEIFDLVIDKIPALYAGKIEKFEIIYILTYNYSAKYMRLFLEKNLEIDHLNYYKAAITECKPDDKCECLELFVESFNDIEKYPELMVLVCERNDYETAKYLLSKNVPITTEALTVAINNCCMKIVELFVEEGADTKKVKELDFDHRYMYDFDYFSYIKYLCTLDLESNISAIMELAIMTEKLDSVKYVCETHADKLDSDCLNNSLASAVDFHNIDIIKYLLEIGADVNSLGRVVLYLYVNHRDTFDLVINAGFDPRLHIGTYESEYRFTTEELDYLFAYDLLSDEKIINELLTAIKYDDCNVLGYLIKKGVKYDLDGMIALTISKKATQCKKYLKKIKNNEDGNDGDGNDGDRNDEEEIEMMRRDINDEEIEMMKIEMMKR